MFNYLMQSRLNLNKNLFQRFRLLNKASNNSTCSYIRNLNSAPLTSKKLVELSAKTSFNCVRHNSFNHDSSSEKISPATGVLKQVISSLNKTIRNFITLHFNVRLFLDSDFDSQDFISRSQKTVEEVSKKIAECDFDSLKGLVSPDEIAKIQKSMFFKCLRQRREMSVDAADILWSCIDEVKILYVDEETRFLEITIIHRVLKGWAEIKKRGKQLSDDMTMQPKYEDRVFVCKYQFSRIYKRGFKNDWIIISLNHNHVPGF